MEQIYSSLSVKMQSIYPSVFQKPEVVNELRRLHTFELVPADKASNIVVIVCKKKLLL
jgi:hypothetical protein